MKLIIIRGVSGSGKTTFAETFKLTHFEADEYFVRPDCTYDFNPRLLKNAHEWCYSCVRGTLEWSQNVIVANTFTRLWEMQKYIDLAKEFDAELVVYRCVGRYQNVHGVPEAKVDEMLKRFEDCPGEVLIGETK